MATFLGWSLALVSILAAWGWRVSWLQFKLAENTQHTLGECEAQWGRDSLAWIEEGKKLIQERDAAMAERDDLIIKIQERAALPPAAVQPSSRRIRAGYATIRKAVEANNRHEAEIEEKREQDTAFVE